MAEGETVLEALAPPVDGHEPATAPVLDPAALCGLIESLLFVAPAPTPVARLVQVLGATPEALETALHDLGVAYHAAGRGLRLQRKGDRVQLTSSPEASQYIERFLGLDLNSRLSPAALEALAVIAYRQPLTRAEIEQIRGVNCDGVVRTLLARELIEPVGRLEQAGRPYLYATTPQFLHYFAIDALDQLPPLPEPVA